MYLERSDFLDNGAMHPRLLSSPVFVIFQRESCFHCKIAKPAFQELANDGIIRCMTVQTDGERQSERDIGRILTTIYPDFPGYPSYMLFMPDGRRIPYNGKRDKASMRQFVLSQR